MLMPCACRFKVAVLRQRSMHPMRRQPGKPTEECEKEKRDDDKQQDVQIAENQTAERESVTLDHAWRSAADFTARHMAAYDRNDRADEWQREPAEYAKHKAEDGGGAGSRCARIHVDPW